ncbi:hypothetical protein E5F05_04630 (plasmid) [Deinococcus metallilatus]|uniref:Uncharacterized protein n=1 Tax=Deinococcus metallilatus TaxID=1211322 RepID=A0AAJ5K6F2_9DEIO|nr:hypothetical protein [Deinococcus metallilatus]MBB5293768.1 hypothetical protein [Deinococcus metallilatus]QBY07273.1 hypothetical protein E5F05_04630 [Deinococcus metallilatus]RXJ14745.1 hypothetical protein ERJ73_03360 [Deinococcus metallilatus]TLK30865.1 hypothetical protein FCS05_03675 [Deinococcus metallilatus]GMA17697.1 hypothetical protein GCM10025871_40280 [Deinococcus metallilatus]
MSDADKKVQALDDEILEDTVLVHRRMRPRVQRRETLVTLALRALLEAPEGRLETPILASDPVRR